ncbi:BON domain-containing protein [Azospirillum argentinense]|uniref:BON domain-containing protein n=1 Tax=Azospirillum argentinense TaxID=2970906 RepID=UPI0027E23CF0|nr:BON domain-containing protein [Azospirillum argentinense]
MGSTRPRRHRGAQRHRPPLGFVSTESQRDAIRVAAEEVPGVKGVENNIQVVDPVESGAWGGII